LTRQRGAEGLSESSLALHRTIPPWRIGFRDPSYGLASRIVWSGVLARPCWAGGVASDSHGGNETG